MISGGCIVSGATIDRSLLFSNVRVNSYTDIKNCVILPNVDIGRNCRIKNAIIDKGCTIPENTVIGEDLEKDKKQFYISPGGIVLITAEMLGQELHHVR
jgi:glucose-1-phosphate adenylyltransferase